MVRLERGEGAVGGRIMSKWHRLLLASLTLSCRMESSDVWCGLEGDGSDRGKDKDEADDEWSC